MVYKKGNSSIIGFLVFLLIGLLISLQLPSQSVEVRVTNIRNTKGQLFVAFFLNEYVSLDLGLGYANASGENKDSHVESTTTGTTFMGGISIYF